MIAVHPIASPESIVDTMIQLATAARSHRVIVAGSYLSLCRRGFTRVAIITDCRGLRALHDVGFVAGQETIQGFAPPDSVLESSGNPVDMGRFVRPQPRQGHATAVGTVRLSDRMCGQVRRRLYPARRRAWQFMTMVA
jgi:hypothetical protein